MEPFCLTIPDLPKPQTTLASRPNGIGIIYNPTISQPQTSFLGRPFRPGLHRCGAGTASIPPGWTRGLAKKIMSCRASPVPLLDQKNDNVPFTHAFKKGTRKVNLHSINYHPEYRRWSHPSHSLVARHRRVCLTSRLCLISIFNGWNRAVLRNFPGGRAFWSGEHIKN